MDGHIRRGNKMNDTKYNPKPEEIKWDESKELNPYNAK